MELMCILRCKNLQIFYTLKYGAARGGFQIMTDRPAVYGEFLASTYLDTLLHLSWMEVEIHAMHGQSVVQAE